jgi:cell wall-associated NlpC family hydrolase
MRHLLIACGLLAALASPSGLASVDRELIARELPSAHALAAVGTRYRYGGRSPETGFDCSGLVAHVFQEAWGLLLPHNAQAQSRIGKSVRAAELAPGDLVFYNTRNRRYSHVGIYVGDGRFVHAPRPGARVRIESIEARYWRARFNGARRLDMASAPSAN